MAGGGTASGRLVVLDRSGRASKAFPLGTGAATIGRAPSCDVRVLLPSVAPHHATLLVHRNQVLIRNEGDGETLVNGIAVSVTALQHNDVMTVGGRQLRWEYDLPNIHRPLAPQPAMYKPGRTARAARRATAGAPAHTDRALHRALLHHRASMPGNAGGKQVAIVQPQRRDTSEQIEKVRSAPNSPRTPNRSRRLDDVTVDLPGPSFNKCPPDTTQATLWIESRKPSASPLERKTSPRKLASPAKSPKTAAKSPNAATPKERKSTPNKKAVEPRKATPRKAVPTPTNDLDSRRSSRTAVLPTPPRVSVPRAASAKKGTPLRMLVLRKAKSAHKPKVTKIEAPLKVDHMKQAALMLMTGRTPRAACLLVNKLSPAPRGRGRRAGGKSVSVVEIADTSEQDSSFAQSDLSLSGVTAIGSPLPSPRKSALKDPKAKRSSRKTESIKFDLSNLESFSSQDEDEAMETGRSTFRESKSIRGSNISNRSNRSSRYTNPDGSASGDDLTLHYTDTSSVKSPSPSPRRSIHSRTNTILELSGSPLKNLERKTLTPPESPNSRKSLRGSALVQRAVESDSYYSRRSTRTLTDQSFDETAESAFQTRTLSPRSARNLESYSIVDLVTSRESNNDTAKSVYDSAGSTRSSSIVFGTPRTAGNRTKSTIDPSSLASSTPYVGRGRPSRSQSSPNVRKSSPNKSTRSIASRRSKSLTTPENSEETQRHISINSTRISRANKSRSRLNDSDLQLITSNTGDGDDSPRTSRRNTTANLSHAINSLSPKKSSPSLLIRTSSPIVSSPKGSKVSSPVKSSPRASNSKQTSPTFTQMSSRSSSRQTISSPRSSSRQDITSPRSSFRQNVTSPRSSSRQNITSPRSSLRQNMTSPKSSSRQNITSPRSSSSQNIISPRSSSSQNITSSKSSLRQNITSPRSSSSQNITNPRSSLRQNITSPRSSSRQTMTSSRSASRQSVASPKNSSKQSTPKTVSPKRATPNTSNSKTSPRNKRSSRSNPTLEDTTYVSSGNEDTPKTASPRNSSKQRASKSLRVSLKRYSPKTVSPKAPRTSSPNISPKSKRGRSALTLDTTYASSENEGTITPENVSTPIEQGTPVLSIRTLLNSTQKSPKAKASNSKNVKRKTIGSIRSGKKSQPSSLKSKSFTASARRSLRSLRLNSKGSDRPNESILSNEEENVTPKTGGVKLVQEAVKNKHSTAKKPQSKRSIIDNLNDSDIVKQLFNSPVKRKLCQSMTEFSRKKLFDDEEVRRPARNTTFARTPDRSILDNTGRYSPDEFVSPLSTPGNSPNPTGIKRLYTRNTPRNDSRNVEGVKSPVRSPSARKSIRNDLTNASINKNLLSGRKSVRNDLTNVSGVKLVFAASPKNDLRRVSGVKSLFRAQKEKTSPKSDLTDVRGVKKLLTRKSVVNDLTNVSGVKKTFANSPKNDLRDVRGVKALFRQSKSRKDNSHDLSGVEELFNESNISSTSHRDPEALFDQLIGKPPIKAVYSKSFLSRRPQKGKKSRRAKSLHTSIDLITNNVEQWLEQELNKHLHKKPSVSRALQQLATDTVEGNEPILQSRVRNSTLTKSNFNVSDKKKSASEIYDAHTLPIKKRSIVEKSLNKSKNKSVRVSGANKTLLPLKKRVVHSTPVKGRPDMTMNASELGRVSPIAAVELTIAKEATSNRSKQIKASPTGKGKRASKIKAVFETEVPLIEEPKKSPPKRSTRSKIDENKPKAKTAEAKSPEKRGRNIKVINVTAEPEQPKAIRARGKVNASSIVQTRNVRNNTAKPKSVSQSPKPKGRKGVTTTTAVTLLAQTRRTRKNTAKQESVIQSPKQTRRKGVNNKTVEAKPSPKRTRGARNANTTRKEIEVTNTKRRRNSLVITKKTPIMSPKAEKTTRSKAKQPIQDSSKKTTPPKATAVKPSPKKTRATLVISKPSPKLNPSSETQTRRGRRQVTEDKPPSPVKPRTKQLPKSPEKKPSPPKRDRSANKAQDSEPPAKRGRRGKNVTIQSPKTTRGKRKSNEEPTVPAKVARTARGRKGVESLVVNISPQGKRTVSPVKETSAKRKNKAAIQKDEGLPEPRSTRRGGARQSSAKRKQSPAKKETPAKKLKVSPIKKATRQAKEPSPKKDNTSANKAKVSPKTNSKKPKASPTKKAKTPAKKAKPSPKQIASPAKKGKVSPKKVISSPAKKVKASPTKAKTASKKVAVSPAKAKPPVKAKAPAKKGAVSSAKAKSPVKAKAPANKAKASTAKKVAASKKSKPSPAKKSKASPENKVKESPVKTRGGRKAAPQIASPPASRRKQATASPAKVVRSTLRRRR